MKNNNQEVEKYRLDPKRLSRRDWNQRFASTRSDGNNGLFLIPRKTGSLLVMVSDGSGWEHVSVSIHKRKRCPTWEEMCFVKDVFWEADEVVIQYHPREADYVNYHDFCLHMWKPIDTELPTPPPMFIGPQKGVTH